MILLISSEYDTTTNIVVRWLVKLNANFKRLNYENQSKLNYFLINDSTEVLKIDATDFSKIKVVWHRRGRLRHIPLALNKTGSVYDYLKKEEDSLIKSIENYLKGCVNYIGSFQKETENFKLTHLLNAKKIGLKIPNSLVTNSKKELVKFKNHYNSIISKDLRYPVNIKTESVFISSVGTFKVTNIMFEKLSDIFAPIFVQEYIEKQFEIRVFFFEEQLYAMAIFSRNDEKTRVDFRNYNDEKPNRCVPFDLPQNLKQKLLKFVELSDLNTGSIDLIFSKKNEFIFLEVNPMGQFDWLSKNCNYYIEKEIAQTFSKYEKNNI